MCGFFVFLQACNSHPDITTIDVERTIVNKVVQIGPSAMDAWAFREDEPRVISMLQQIINGEEASIIIDMQTTDIDGRHKMSGRLKLSYEWLVDNWYLSKVENLSFTSTGNFEKNNSETSSLSPLDQEDVSEIMAGFNQYRLETKNPNSSEGKKRIQGIAGRALSFLEKGRLPGAYIYALGAWDQAAPEHLLNYAARGLTGEYDGANKAEKRILEVNFSRTCTDSEQQGSKHARIVFDFMNQIAPHQRTDYAYRACNFQRFNFVSLREMPRDISYTEVWLVFAIHNYLEEHNALGDSERRLLKAMLTGS
jgi:hypothetical protein